MAAAVRTPSSPSQALPTTATADPNTKLLRLPASCDPPSETHPPSRKTWLIFGATGHIGRSIVNAALNHGDNVAAVGRIMETPLEQMQNWHERCEGLLCDVRVRETVDGAVRGCLERFGEVDVVVNCTGYGVMAACEDQDAHDLRSQFDTNFFGTVNIIHATLPHFRARASSRSPDSETDDLAGRYLIFSSTSGALGVPGLGPYCATKYAVEGLIESMLYEIDAFGVKATLVEPGHVRLDEGQKNGDVNGKGSDSHMDFKVEGADVKANTEAAIANTNHNDTTITTDASEQQQDQQQQQDHSSSPSGPLLHRKRYGHFFVKPPSAPYSSPSSPSLHAQRVVQWLSDRQPTSADKSAELVWQLGHCRFPPLRLLLGAFAVESVRDRLRSIIEEIEDWKFLNFPVGEDTAGGGGGGGGSGSEAVSGNGNGAVGQGRSGGNDGGDGEGDDDMNGDEGEGEVEDDGMELDEEIVVHHAGKS